MSLTHNISNQKMNNNITEIFSPRFEGDRFKEHRLPLDLLEDLSTLRDMTIEMAKHIYLEENPNRKRVPKNFTKGISFELESLEEGSTIPKIIMISTMIGLFARQNTTFFEQAKDRIIQAVQASDTDNNINEFAPDNVLNYFNKFGKKLRADEFVEFNPKGKEKAKFTKENRRKLILASSKSNEYTEEIKLRGFISEMDQAKKTFHIQFIDEKRVESSYTELEEDILKTAFLDYSKKQKVLINGTGKFSKSSKLLKMEKIDEIILLENNDVGFRLEEFSILKDGWLNGEGISFDSDSLNWISDKFEDDYDPELPTPSIFPTPEGNIQMEWSSPKFELSLNIDISKHTALFQVLNLENDNDSETELNLELNDDWKKINSEVKTIMEV